MTFTIKASAMLRRAAWPIAIYGLILSIALGTLACNDTSTPTQQTTPTTTPTVTVTQTATDALRSISFEELVAMARAGQVQKITQEDQTLKITLEGERTPTIQAFYIGNDLCQALRDEGIKVNGEKGVQVIFITSPETPSPTATPATDELRSISFEYLVTMARAGKVQKITQENKNLKITLESEKAPTFQAFYMGNDLCQALRDEGIKVGGETGVQVIQ